MTSVSTWPHSVQVCCFWPAAVQVASLTVSQNGTLRTYTGAYDTATLTGDLDTLRYLQDHGAQTIQFVTNGQTSSFAINDLLAQGSGSEVFYLTHRGAEEPTLLLVEADHSELVKD